MGDTPREAALRPDPRCQHEHDPLNPGRKCDSRCNEGSSEPWHRLVEGGPGNHTAHAWCLPQHYTVAGWVRGPGPTALPMEARKCYLCDGEMTRFPR